MTKKATSIVLAVMFLVGFVAVDHASIARFLFGEQYSNGEYKQGTSGIAKLVDGQPHATTQVTVPVSTAVQAEPGVIVETPCKVPGLNDAPTCVVVKKKISGNEPTVNVNFDVSPAKYIPAGTQNFSVVYEYRVIPGGLNDSIDIMFHLQDQMAMVDVYTDKSSYFWVTTHDGGQTWTKIAADNPHAIMSF